MSLDIATAAQLAPYEDEEEIQLMDMDEANLQAEEQILNTSTLSTMDQEKKQETDTIYETEDEDKKSSLLVIEVRFIVKKRSYFASG